jgi:phasin family protein
MTASNPTEFAAAAKAQLETQQAVWAELTTSTLENVRELVELNLKVMKESMGESAAAAKELLEAKTPKEFLSLSASQTRPNIEKVLAYGRQVAAITSKIQSVLGKAVKTQRAESTQRVEPVIEKIAKTAPPGSGNAYAAMKAALEKTNAGYEQWMKMTQQAAKQIEAKMTDAAAEFTQVAKKAVRNVAIAETKVVSPAKTADAPAEKPAAPAAEKAAAPAKKVAAPAKKAAAPAKKAAAPAKKAVAPAKNAVAAEKEVAAPAKKAVARKKATK